jgi:hypothetical protein
VDCPVEKQEELNPAFTMYQQFNGLHFSQIRFWFSDFALKRGIDNDDATV